MMPDKLVLLPRINNDQDVSYVSIETPTMNYVLENGLEWSAKKPFEDAVSTERLQSIFELVGQIEPVEIIPATKNAKGIKFDIQEGEKTMQFVLDIKNHVMMVQGQNPYAVRVETPQQFETLLLEHLQNIRKRDLYPFTINDIDMIDIVKEKKSIHMKKNENGDWNATGLDDSSLQYEIVSTLEELKIDAWTDRKNFERVGDIEIVLGSKKGMAYTWHLGKSKDGKQMLLNIPKFTVGLVDQAKLEELINKL